jgi:hypothetical protein
MLTHPPASGCAASAWSPWRRRSRSRDDSPDLDGLGFEERLALLVEREATGREDRRLRPG